MHLLYLTFGNRTEVHSQAAFSILSFLKEENRPATINIITDQPPLYRHLGQQVNVITLSATELKAWEGEQQFFWRVKIKALEKICAVYPGQPVMYVDTDTFLNSDLATLQQWLQDGKALMHLYEGPLSTKKSKTEKKMWRQLQGKTFAGILMQPTDCMWNAGVVATPNQQQNAECRLALALCDEMCQQGVTRRLIEQYALSIALEKTYGLKPAQGLIAHYWQVKDLWNSFISQFFLQARFSEWSLEETLQQAAQIDFNQLPIGLTIRNTNRRIKQWADKLFPSKNPVYFFTHPHFL